jgi:hypothetical protein
MWRFPHSLIRGMAVFIVFVPVCVLAPGLGLGNEAPVVDDFSASSGTVVPGGTVALVLQAHDPDCPGTCTDADGCGEYIRADVTFWSATGGTILNENNGVSGSPYTATADWQAPETEGVYTISIYVADSGGFACGGRQSVTPTIDIQVTTSTNLPPVVDSLTADPLQLFPGETSSLVCVASDPDEDPLTYSWDTDSGSITPGTEGNATFTATEPGIATATCTATDPGALFGSDSIGISVVGAVADKAIQAGLVAPRRLAIDSSSNVYVVGSGKAGIRVVSLFDDEPVYRIALPGVTSVAVDWADNLLVGTVGGAKVIDRQGSHLLSLPANTKDVVDVAVDPVNRYYGVLHQKSGQVRVYDELGAPVITFGSTGDGADQFKSPQGLAVTPTGQWVVADTGHGLIKIFDGSGTLVSSFGGLGNGAGEFVHLDDVAVDAAGVIYASDSFQSWVQAFNPDGSPRETLGTHGGDVGQFKTATGIAPADDFDRIVVASLNSSSLQVFRTSDEPVIPPDPAVGTVSPTRLDFTAQAVGSVSTPQSLSVDNAGASPLGLRDVTVQGDFVQTNDCSGLLDPTQSCSVDVSFRPTAPGERNGALILDTSGEPARIAVQLTGTAFPPVSAVSLEPGLLVFGDQLVGTTSTPLSVILTNSGTAPLELLSIEASSNFSQTNDCTGPLAPGAGCTISVRFAPLVVGDPIAGALTVSSNAPGSPHTVELSGRATPVVPSIAIDDVGVDEGNAGDPPNEALFTVTLSEPTTEVVTVEYATASDTAVEGEDFEATSGTLTFLDGETSQPIAVPIIGDDLLEADEEYFFVHLSNPLNAVLGNDTGEGAIFDDEECEGPNLLLNPSAEEKSDERGILNWTVVAGEGWLRGQAPPVPVDGSHYFYYTGTTPGGELIQDVDVSAYAERIAAGRQWFTFDAFVWTYYDTRPDSARVIVEYRDFDNATVLDSFDSGEISSPSQWTHLVDERPAPNGTGWIRIRLIGNYPSDAYFDAFALRSLRTATVAVDDIADYEGHTGFRDATFTVRLACPFAEEVLVDYATRDVIALAGEDYLSNLGTVALPVGATSTTVPVSIVGDFDDEPHESFALDLSLVEPTDALLLDGEGICLIVNDDFCPQESNYWAANPTIWPVLRLELGGVEYTQATLLTLVAYWGSDVSHQLARELIATKLNLEVGSDPYILLDVEAADAYLEVYPPGSRPQGDDRRLGRQLTETLRDYNRTACE